MTQRPSVSGHLRTDAATAGRRQAEGSKKGCSTTPSLSHSFPLDVGMVGNGNGKVGTGSSLGFGSGAAHCLQQPAGSGSGKVRLGGWPAGEGTSTV